MHDVRAAQPASAEIGLKVIKPHDAAARADGSVDRDGQRLAVPRHDEHVIW